MLSRVLKVETEFDINYLETACQASIPRPRGPAVDGGVMHISLPTLNLNSMVEVGSHSRLEY